MQPEVKEETNTIADRLYKLLNAILSDGSAVPKAYHPIILNMVKPYLKKTDDGQLRNMIEKLRDEVIPWILNGDKN